MSSAATSALSSNLSAEVELLEAEVWASLHGAYARAGGEQTAAIKRWGRAAALVTRNADAVAVNRALGFGFERRFDLEQFAEIRTFFRENGKSRWFLECSPDAAIETAALVAAGGVIGGSVVKLVAEVDTLPDTPELSLEVREATESDAATFMELVGAQLGVPEPVRPGIVAAIGHRGWRFYFALHEHRPIAGAAMFVDREGAWFGLGGTLPEYRKRGAQTALLSRRIQDARSLECRWISAETAPEERGPNPSLRNMKRIGMRQLYQRPWYRFNEETSRPAA